MTVHTIGWTAYGLAMEALAVAIWRSTVRRNEAVAQLGAFKQRANRHQKRDP